MKEAATKRVDRIGVVATDTLRVLGLQSILPQFEVVHLTAPGALDDVNLALVLIDAECTGHLFELLATFHHIRPQLKLIVLGTETGPEYIQRIIGTGAKGYLTLTATETELAMAIEMVRDGSVWAPRRVLSQLLDRQPGFSGTAGAPPKFTPRELQVLELLRAGRSNREIGIALGIDESTVKAHIGRLLRKVGVNNRIALTIHPFTQFE
ncbi:MAG: response regulator transcription factor [Acidobacteriaceae bacterium]|jgi:DNA-binding NarL/FixJ family response regulator